MAAWLGRLGILVIHNDPVPEAELWAMAPPGVTVHAARFESPTSNGAEYRGTSWAAMASAPDVGRGLRQLGQLGVDAICLCFGSASFFGGAEFDNGFATVGRAVAGGTPVFTAAEAIADALRSLGLTRPLVVMPPWFTQPTFDATRRYLTAAGFGIAGLAQFDLGADWAGVAKHRAFDRGARWHVSSEDVHDQVERATPADADCVLIPGSGFRSLEAIAPLERRLGRPVVTSNQACLWYFLRRAGLSAPIEGYGRLLGDGGGVPATRPA